MLDEFGVTLLDLLLKPLLSILKFDPVNLSKYFDIRLPTFLKKLLFVKSFNVFKGQEFCRSLCQLRCRKDSLNALVVSRWNRIKLVIMTAGTLQRMTEKRLSDTVGDII